MEGRGSDNRGASIVEGTEREAGLGEEIRYWIGLDLAVVWKVVDTRGLDILGEAGRVGDGEIGELGSVGEWGDDGLGEAGFGT